MVFSKALTSLHGNRQSDLVMRMRSSEILATRH